MSLYPGRYRLSAPLCKPVLRVEGLAGFEDGEFDVDELSHGGADVGLAGFAVGLKALAEGPDGRVEGQG